MENRIAINYINELRKAKNLSVQALSDLANVPKSTLDKVLSGQTENPQFSLIVSVVKALGGSLDEMYGLPQKASPLQHEEALAYEREIARLKARIEEQSHSHRKSMDALVEAHKNSTTHLKDRLHFQTILVGILLVALAVLIVTLLVFLWDALHSDWGRFQLREISKMFDLSKLFTFNT